MVRHHQLLYPEFEELKKQLDRQKSEIALLKKIIYEMPGSIYWKDKNGVYLYRNGASGESMKSLGFLWYWEDIVGKTDYDLFPQEMADGFRAHDIEVMESRKESIKEETATSPSGETIIQLSTKKPLYNEYGEVIGVIGNTIDITYLKKIEAELREANQLKLDFIHNMEHDIRTPFVGVFGMVDMLAKQETDVRKKRLLEEVAGCAKQLLDYCNSILDFSKIDAKEVPVLVRKFELYKLIDGIIAMEMPAAEIKQLQLSVEMEPDIPDIIMGDDHRLQRILINLMSNSVKFTDHGYVKLSIKKLKQPNNRYVVLQFIVADSGIGIPADKQTMIYEKFTRATPANKGLYHGQGLGLRIVKQFVEEMEGDIDLNSVEKQGTEFICTLPFKLPLSASEL